MNKMEQKKTDKEFNLVVTISDTLHIVRCDELTVSGIGSNLASAFVNFYHNIMTDYKDNISSKGLVDRYELLLKGR